MNAITRTDPTLPRPGWQEQTCFNPCPACEGEGVLTRVIDWDRMTGAPMEDYAPCHVCNGNGEIEEPVQPVTLDDLDAIPPLEIPDDLPDYARDMLSMIDDGYTRAAKLMADDPAMHRGSPQAEAHAALLRLDPRLPLAMDAHLLVTGRASLDDGGMAVHLAEYIKLLTAQAEARRAAK
jgi:hypothetical protein